MLDRAQGVATVNTWGDALHVVLDDAVAAARALGLQDVIGSTCARRGCRSILHCGWARISARSCRPSTPVRRVATFTGSHVSRTACIEPVTPPGAIYVTNAFAAALLLGGREELACDYVGHMPAAKDWGRLRMYRLRRRR